MEFPLGFMYQHPGLGEVMVTGRGPGGAMELEVQGSGRRIQTDVELQSRILFMAGVRQRAAERAADPLRGAVPRGSEPLREDWASRWPEKSRPDWGYDGLYYRVVAFVGSPDRHVSFTIKVPERKTRWFEERYDEVTNREPFPGWGGPMHVIPEGETSNGYLMKYFCEGVVRFRASMAERRTIQIMSSGGRARVKNDAGSALIRNNALMWELLRLGFRFGSHQDLGAVRSEVPERYWSDFDAGAAGRM